MKKTTPIVHGHLLAILTIIIWGTTFISTKILLEDFSPFEILVYRFSLGYVMLLVMHPHLVKTKSWQEEGLLMGAGLCGVTLYFLLENIALTYTLASNAGIIVSVAPFFTAVIAHFCLKEEKLKAQFFAGFAIALIGIILISWNGSSHFKLSPIGDLLTVLACVIWAAYSVLMRKISALHYSTIGATRRVFLYGLLFMAPITVLLDVTPDFSRFSEAANLFNILYLGIGASALCFVTWNWCVGVLGAIQTSAYIYMVPVITIIAAYVFLHEPITPIALTGAAITLIGLILSEKKEGFRIKRAQTRIDSQSRS